MKKDEIIATLGAEKVDLKIVKVPAGTYTILKNNDGVVYDIKEFEGKNYATFAITKDGTTFELSLSALTKVDKDGFCISQSFQNLSLREVMEKLENSSKLIVTIPEMEFMMAKYKSTEFMPKKMNVYTLA